MNYSTKIIFNIFFKSSLIFIIAISFIAIFYFFSIAGAQQNNSDVISGYAWSSNIGWISFNDSNVTVANNGNLEGYAWSSNIGWIRFGNLSNFPGSSVSPPSPPPATPFMKSPIKDGFFGFLFPDQVLAQGQNGNARINPGNNGVTGWVRACAAFVSGCSGEIKNINGTELGGWDGWISLSGENYGVVLLDEELDYSDLSVWNQNSFAWGDTVVGWVNFAGVYRGEEGSSMSLGQICQGNSNAVEINLNNLSSGLIEIFRDNNSIHTSTLTSSSFTYTDAGVSRNNTYIYRVVITLPNGNEIEFEDSVNVTQNCGSNGPPTPFYSINNRCDGPNYKVFIEVNNVNDGDLVIIRRNGNEISRITTTPYEFEDSSIEENVSYVYEVFVNNNSLGQRSITPGVGWTCPSNGNGGPTHGQCRIVDGFVQTVERPRVNQIVRIIASPVNEDGNPILINNLAWVISNDLFTQTGLGDNSIIGYFTQVGIIEEDFYMANGESYTCEVDVREAGIDET